MTSARRIATISVIGLGISLIAGGCSSDSGESTASAPESTSSLPSEVQEQLQKVLDDAHAKFNFPGVQAGVWVDGEQWIGTWGVAAEGTSQSITPADHTRIGSITKTMTGTVILQLIDEGKLSFDDVIDKYVPGMPNGEIATIKNLIEMQSGIPNYTRDTDVVNQYAAEPTTVFSPRQLVNSVKTMEPMFEPETHFFYSNTNFVLLGMVIEKVTAKSIPENFKARILDPLNMSQTSAPGGSAEIPAPFLSGVSEQANPLGQVKNATNWNPSFAFTAGEMISTLEDLHKWGVALGTGRDILPAEPQQMRVDSVKTTVRLTFPRPAADKSLNPSPKIL